jgi:polar amino acid transport system substrate-binding protein
MILRLFFIAISICVLSQEVYSKEKLDLHMAEAPPLTLNNATSGHGMVGDVALAAISRAGYLSQLHVAPWLRAQKRVIEGDNQLIIPLSRTPERENFYTWIAPLMKMERAFFSLDNPVTDLAEARERYKRIAVGVGTPQLEFLKSHGFSDDQIVSIKLNDNPGRMLELGRVQAWFTGVPEGLYHWPGSRTELRMSPVMFSTDIYLACSRRCDKVLVEELRQAVEALRQEGVVQSIQDSYLPQH